jgi:hypothetical protein
MSKPRPLAVRAVAVATALLVGCSSSGARQASDRHELICLGMTQKDVKSRIGGPTEVRATMPVDGSPPAEEWVYVYGGASAADIFGTILVTVVVVALVVVVVAAAAGGKGGGNFGGFGGLGGGGGGDDGYWQFSLVFDAQGRVRTITPIRPAGK